MNEAQYCTENLTHNLTGGINLVKINAPERLCLKRH